MVLEWIHNFNSIAWVVSNILVAYIAAVLIIFVVGYFSLFDPRATTGGRFIFRFALSLIGVIGLVFISLFIDPRLGAMWYMYPGDVLLWRPSVRLIAYAYVAYTITGLAVLLVVRKWFPHKLRTAADRELVKDRRNSFRS